ncbi:hypothetical protein [Sphingobium sp.]|uniref:nucleotide-binding protein n=1 Tax=Sphingobium sp. TaxID=1912891 RepID=UPI0025D8DB08|nr:hypothetical protein [Sphingobium sp.]
MNGGLRSKGSGVPVHRGASGRGKTMVTAALARRHRQAGRRVRVFKCGPDFVDPMILERASGASMPTCPEARCAATVFTIPLSQRRMRRNGIRRARMARRGRRSIAPARYGELCRRLRANRSFRHRRGTRFKYLAKFRVTPYLPREPSRIDMPASISGRSTTYRCRTYANRMPTINGA